MEEQDEIYSKLQEYKDQLKIILEAMKQLDKQLGASEEGTFIDEVQPILSEVFPNCI